MLNRLFIAIGVLVILTLISAFLLPRFITWADYRPRLEAMASDAFGTRVAIDGEIALTLLPQPELRMTKLKIGPPDAPVVEVADVEASFSLLDFLGDHYKVTQLTIDQPVVNVSVGSDGSLSQGLAIAAGDAEPNVSVANAQVVGGVVHIADARSGESRTIENVGGTLTLEAIRGPFSFEGQGTLEGKTYAAHVGLGSLDATGGPALSLFVQSQGARETLQTDGILKGGRYGGAFKYRQAPPGTKKGEATDAGRGDFTLDGKFDAGTDRVLLSDYTALPDENRPTTRLTGAAELRLGLTPTFNAVVSGGSVVLPPRDATAEIGDPPYELVRLLGELPMPPVPPIAGSVGLDLTDLNLREVALRGLSLQAETDGKGWTLKSLTANLPGNTTLSLTGTITAAGTRPAFAGRLRIDSKQLDRLAALWRKPSAEDPLFDVPGSFSGNVTLSADKLVVSSAALMIDQTTHPLSAEIAIGPQRSLKLSANLGTLSADDSVALAALMPDLTANGSFGTTFPSGDIHLSAAGATVLGLAGTGLVADASWEGGVLNFSKLAASDLGGASFDGTITAFGTLVKPEISGSGSIKIAAGSAALGKLLAALATPKPVADVLSRALPADLTVKLDAPSGSGGQALAVVGTLGSTNARLSGTLSAGLANALKAPISARLDLDADRPSDLVALLGLGDVPPFDTTAPLRLTASVDGVPSNSYETHVALASGSDHIDFAGNVVPGDFTSITGSGDLDVALADPAALAQAIGAGGVYLPAISGKARLKFDGPDNLKLSEIAIDGVSGNLALARQDNKATLTGALKLASIDVRKLLPFLVGAPGTLDTADSTWPDGPIDLGDAARTSEGRIDVTTPSLTSDGAPMLTDVAFGLDWDAQNLHLRALSGKTGGGTATLDATLCCTGPNLPTKQLNGRLALEGVDLAAIAPKPVSAVLAGTIQSSAEFSGSGTSLAEAMRALTGSGSFTVNDFTAAHFDPALFTGLAGLTDVVDMEPDALTATVVDKLGAGAFKAPSLTGSFTIAGGVLRSPNLAITGDGARIFGSGTLDLGELDLEGRYAMTPTTVPDAASPLDPNSAEADVAISGSLWAPRATYDVAALVDGMKIKASEAELAILEQRKTEADARAKQQAEEDARRAAELKAAQAAIVAEQAAEAAANLAADAAQKQAAENAAKAKEAAAAAPAPAPAPPPPAASSSAVVIDLGL